MNSIAHIRTELFNYNEPVLKIAKDVTITGDIVPVGFNEVVAGGDYLILDTETTGLDFDDEICQIAIIDSDGNILMNELVKPKKRIPLKAIDIHGIDNEMVANAHTFDELRPRIIQTLIGRDVIVYNASYDLQIIVQSSKVLNLPFLDWKKISVWWCAMQEFSCIYGDWSEYRQSYRWQKLSTACEYYSIPVSNAHNALGDCLMTLEVVKKMCGVK